MLSGNTSTTANQWVNITLSVDKSKKRVKFYENGSLISEISDVDIDMNDDISGSVLNRGYVILTMDNGSEKKYNLTIDTVTDAEQTKTPWVLVTNYIHQGGTNPELKVRGVNDGFPLLPTDNSLNFVNVNINANEVFDGSAEASTWGHAGPDMFNKLCEAMGGSSEENEYNTNGLEMRFVGKTSGHDRVMHFKSSWGQMFKHFRTVDKQMSMTDWPSTTYTLYGAARNGVSPDQLHSTYLPGTANRIFNETFDEHSMTEFPFYHAGPVGALWSMRARGKRWEMDDHANHFNNSTYHQIWVRGDKRNSRLNWVNTRSFSLQDMLVGSSLMSGNRFKGMISDVSVFEQVLTDEQVGNFYTASQDPTPPTLPLNEWSHVAVNHNAHKQQLDVYLNGDSYGRFKNFNGNVLKNTNSINMGKGFTGEIGETILMERKLLNKEIAELTEDNLDSQIGLVDITFGVTEEILTNNLSNKASLGDMGLSQLAVYTKGHAPNSKGLVFNGIQQGAVSVPHGYTYDEMVMHAYVNISGNMSARGSLIKAPAAFEWYVNVNKKLVFSIDGVGEYESTAELAVNQYNKVSMILNKFKSTVELSVGDIVTTHDEVAFEMLTTSVLQIGSGLNGIISELKMGLGNYQLNDVNYNTKVLASFTFDESDGVEAIDMSSFENNGLIMNGATRKFGTYDIQSKGIQLDAASNHYITVLGGPYENYDMNTITLSAWVYTANDGSAGDKKCILMKEGVFEWCLDGTGVSKLYDMSSYEFVASEGVTIESNVWTHLAVVVDEFNNQVVFYRNGEEVNAVVPNTSINLPRNSSSLVIGRMFTGVLDNVIMHVGRVDFAATPQLYRLPDSQYSPAKITEDEWNHIAAVFDKDLNTINMYQNGDYVGSYMNYLQHFSDIGKNANDITIGTVGDSVTFFDGIMDDVRIYKTSLNAQGIKDLYAIYSQPNRLFDESQLYESIEYFGGVVTVTNINLKLPSTLKSGANVVYYLFALSDNRLSGQDEVLNFVKNIDSLPVTLFQTRTLTTNGSDQTSQWNPDPLTQIVDAGSLSLESDTTYALRTFVYFVARDYEDNIDYIKVELPRTFPEISLYFTASIKQNDTIGVFSGGAESVNRYFIFAFRGMLERGVVMEFVRDKLVPNVPATSGGALYQVNGHDVYSYHVYNVIPTAVGYLLPVDIVLSNAFTSAIDTNTTPLGISSTELFTTYMVGIDVSGFYHVVSSDPYYFQPTTGPSVSTKYNDSANHNRSTRKLYLNINMYHHRSYKIQRILEPYASMDTWYTERSDGNQTAPNEWTFTFSEYNRLICVSINNFIPIGFTELARGWENVNFQASHWSGSADNVVESYKDFAPGETVTIPGESRTDNFDGFFMTTSNRPDSSMPIVTRLTAKDFVHTGVLASGGVESHPLVVVYKFEQPSNDGIQMYEVSMQTGTTVPVKRVTMFATKTFEYNEVDVAGFYDTYVRSVTQSNSHTIVHIAPYDLNGGFSDMSVLDSTLLTHAYTDLYGTTEAVSGDSKYVVYFIVHDVNDTITVKSKHYLKEYVLRDVDYSTIELVPNSAGSTNHPESFSVNNSSHRMGAQRISTDGQWMLTSSSEYYSSGAYTTIRPGYFNIFKNVSDVASPPSYEHYCHILIPEAITITQGEGDDLVVIPEKSGNTVYRSGVSRSSITHDGTYVLVNGSNWAAVFKHDLVNKTYTLYSSLNRQMTQVVGYHTNANNSYRHKCGSGRISDNGEYVLLYGTSDTNANREDITCGVWRNTGTDFELIQGDGFKWAFKHSNYIGYGMDISGDGRTIVVCNGGRLDNNWRHGQYGYIDMGFRVYRLNPITNVYDMVQYARYNNWNNSVIETEENTSHDFLELTKGESTIGKRMPVSGWVQGIPNRVTMSYDGNSFILSGTRARDGQSAMVALYVYNSLTKRYEFNSNFTNGDSQYGLGYTNNRTPYGNNQPCHYPQAVCISAYGDYVYTTGQNYNTVFYVFKRQPDGYYKKVYAIQTHNWQGGQNTVLAMGAFGGNGGFIGAGNYIYLEYNGTRRVVSPIQPHISRNERSVIPIKVNDLITTSVTATVDPYTKRSARKTPWVLVLNYLHKGYTNPELNARNVTGNMPVLPVDGSLDFDAVDIDGEVPNSKILDSASWGHAGFDLFDKLCKALGSAHRNDNDLEVRFVSKTNSHDRKIHFSTNWNRMLNNFRTYTEPHISEKSWSEALANPVYGGTYTKYNDHTARLPETATAFFDQVKDNDGAMTDMVFYKPGGEAWSPGEGNWGADHSGAPEDSTYHQIWVRVGAAANIKSTVSWNGSGGLAVSGTVFSNSADITVVYPPVAFTPEVNLTDPIKLRDFFETNITPTAGVTSVRYTTTSFPNQTLTTARTRLSATLTDDNAEVRVKETNWGSITANTPTYELPPDQITDTVSGKYGRRCAISADGRTALVTAPINQTSGEAYIWRFDGSTWSFAANLSMSSGLSGYYGDACALSADGKTALVGGYYDNTKGCAFIWKFDGTNWGVSEGEDGFKPNHNLSIGSPGRYCYSCALSGDGNVALIGGSVDRNGGAAYLWRYVGDTWVVTGLSNPGSDDDAEYGYSCALSGDGNVALIAGPNNNNTSVGNAFIWEYNIQTNEWGMFDWSNTFMANEAHDLTGANLQRNGASTNGRYGQACALSLDGKTAVISGWLSATAGGAWVWQHKDGEWGMYESDGTFTPKMAHNLSSSQMSGYTTAYYGLSCSISGDGRTVIIGDDTDGNDGGKLWLWEYDASAHAWGAFDADSAFTANAPHDLSMTSGAKGDYARSCSMSASGQYVMVSGANESANGEGGPWIWEANVSGDRVQMSFEGKQYAALESLTSSNYQVVIAVIDSEGNFDIGGQVISRLLYRQWPPPDATATKGTLGSTSEWTLSNATYGNGSYKAVVSPGLHSSHNTYGVFDNKNDGLYWHSNHNNRTGVLTIHLPQAFAMVAYSITHRTYHDKEHSPKNWTIDGSNDDSTWTTIDTQSDQGTSYDNLKPRLYRFSNSTKYKHYRINVTANNGGAYLMLSEWRMYERFSAPSIYGPTPSISPLPGRDTLNITLDDGTIRTLAVTTDAETDSNPNKTPWILVLNYMHKAGTNPDLSVRNATDNLPLLPEDGSLNIDMIDIGDPIENGSTYDPASWGHTGNDLFDKVCKALGSESDNANGLEVRFVGKSGKSGNDRLVHFKSDFDPLIKDYRYGNVAQAVYRLDENNKFTEFTLLEGHTAYLPDQDIVAMTEGTGDAAMTDGLFVSISSGNYHFYIGNGGRWESDDTNSGSANNTYHQIWVRADKVALGTTLEQAIFSGVTNDMRVFGSVNPAYAFTTNYYAVASTNPDTIGASDIQSLVNTNNNEVFGGSTTFNNVVTIADQAITNVFDINNQIHPIASVNYASVYLYGTNGLETAIDSVEVSAADDKPHLNIPTVYWSRFYGLARADGTAFSSVTNIASVYAPMVFTPNVDVSNDAEIKAFFEANGTLLENSGGDRYAVNQIAEQNLTQAYISLADASAKVDITQEGVYNIVITATDSTDNVGVGKKMHQGTSTFTSVSALNTSIDSVSFSDIDDNLNLVGQVTPDATSDTSYYALATTNPSLTLDQVRDLSKDPANSAAVVTGEVGFVSKITIDGIDFPVTLDTTTDSSSDKTPWILVLNYMHKTGTSPSLNARHTGNGFPVLPVDGSIDFDNVDINGTVEDGSVYHSQSWGHTGYDLFNKLCLALGSPTRNVNGLEVRFLSKTNNHNRKIHFKTNWNRLLNEFRTNTETHISGTSWETNMAELSFGGEYSKYSDHTALLPETATSYFDQAKDNDGAMTDLVFYKAAGEQWSPGEGRWGADHVGNQSNNTYYQIWVRANSTNSPISKVASFSPMTIPKVLDLNANIFASPSVNYAHVYLYGTDGVPTHDAITVRTIDPMNPAVANTVDSSAQGLASNENLTQMVLPIGTSSIEYYYKMGRVTLSNGDAFYGPVYGRGDNGDVESNVGYFVNGGAYSDTYSRPNFPLATYETALEETTLNDSHGAWVFYYEPSSDAQINKVVVTFPAFDTNYYLIRVDIIENNQPSSATNIKIEGELVSLPAMFSTVGDSAVKFDAVTAGPGKPLVFVIGTLNNTIQMSEINFSFEADGDSLAVDATPHVHLSSVTDLINNQLLVSGTVFSSVADITEVRGAVFAADVDLTNTEDVATFVSAHGTDLNLTAARYTVGALTNAALSVGYYSALSGDTSPLVEGRYQIAVSATDGTNVGVGTKPPVFTLYNSRDFGYTSVTSLPGPSNSTQHPIGKVAKISTNGQYMVGTDNTTSPGKVLVYRNISTQDDPMFTQFTSIDIPADAGLENVTSSNRGNIVSAQLSHDGTRIFAHGSNWAYVFKLNTVTNTYSVYASLAPEYSKIIGYGVSNFRFSQDARMSGNAETIVMISSNSDSNRAGAIWKHNATQERYDLVHKDGFNKVYATALTTSGRACTVSGDGKTVAVYSGTHQWVSRSWGCKEHVGYRVYRYNTETLLFEEIQYTRYANFTTETETEENTNHDFEEQTGGASTIGETTPISSWVDGFSTGNCINLSYDGNWLTLTGANDQEEHMNGFAAIFKRGDDGKYHFVTNFAKGSYGLSYMTGGNGLTPTRWARDSSMSSDGTYLSILGVSQENIITIFKRAGEGDEYTKVYEYKIHGAVGGDFSGLSSFADVEFAGDGSFFLLRGPSNLNRIYKSGSGE